MICSFSKELDSFPEPAWLHNANKFQQFFRSSGQAQCYCHVASFPGSSLPLLLLQTLIIQMAIFFSAFSSRSGKYGKQIPSSFWNHSMLSSFDFLTPPPCLPKVLYAIQITYITTYKYMLIKINYDWLHSKKSERILRCPLWSLGMGKRKLRHSSLLPSQSLSVPTLASFFNSPHGSTSAPTNTTFVTLSLEKEWEEGEGRWEVNQWDQWVRGHERRYIQFYKGWPRMKCHLWGANSQWMPEDGRKEL